MLSLWVITFTIFIYFSEAEQKGSDCFGKFMDMQLCMKDYPELYADKEDDALGEASEDSDKQNKDDKSVTETKSWGFVTSIFLMSVVLLG